jgi:ribulose-5-phosphate 4-epimerase/fuculose-1-phosphate aldolase
MANLPTPPVYKTIEEERQHRKRVLAAGFRLFSKYGYDEGVAGHITARDPEFPDTFWVNPFGVDFSQITVSSLLRVDKAGNVIEGTLPLNRAAFAIHSRIHESRPDVVAAAHSHSIHGRAWSVFGKELSPITQDACAFFEDHSVFNEYSGVVFGLDEGTQIANALGKSKAVILQNHGLLTVGSRVEDCVWWYICLERCCQVQLLVESAQKSAHSIPREVALRARDVVGSPYSGWFQFRALYNRLVAEDSSFLL